MRCWPPVLLGLVLLAPVVRAAPNGYFEIEVIDQDTRRGVPLVELETTSHLKFVTDSAGRVAFHEPGLMGREVYFHVRGHGYEAARDGFGFRGARLTPKAGEKAVVKVRRLNVAERLHRLTGEGIYRDTVLLGHKPPLAEPTLNAGVTGLDSVQAVVHKGKLHWFWGDTNVTRYPLGNFRTTGATSDLPAKGGLAPSVGVDFRYFTDERGYPRAMCPLEKNEGVVWIDGVVVVPDDKGRDRMVAHYARMKSLGEMLEHGIAVWDEEKEQFERATKLDLAERWRFPHGHPVRHRDGENDHLYCGHSFLTVRVKADLKSVLDPKSYEAWTRTDGKPPGWKRDGKPLTPDDEKRALDKGTVKADDLWLLPADVESDKRVRMHGGTVRWNKHRKRWVLVAVEQGGTSFLGEVWYAESDSPTGPWPRARKVATHEKYSFYNPCHHDFFDDGRHIHFEGTYTRTFSGNPTPTPRYEYNQILYRLDLDDPRLKDLRK